MRYITSVIILFNFLFSFGWPTSFINYANTNIIKVQTGRVNNSPITSNYFQLGLLISPSNQFYNNLELGIAIKKQNYIIYYNTQNYNVQILSNLNLPKFSFIKPTISLSFERIYQNIQIDENQNKYKEINQLLSNQQNSDILTKENKVLKDEINKLSIEIQKLNSKIFSKEKQKINDSKQKIEIDENLINLIRMKFENGSNVYEELKLLKKIINDETDVAYLEKLFVLSDRKFRGLDHIKIEFKKMMQDYMNIYYLKNNDNFFIRSISNFIIIEPNSEFDIENQEIKLFSIIQEKIERNDIKTAVFYINQIDKNEFFNSWINQANIYLDFNNNLEKLFN